MTNTPKDLDQTQSPANEAGKELKPCPVPWCERISRAIRKFNGESHWIECSRCGLKTDMWAYPTSAEQQWNTRPEDSRLAEMECEYDRRNRALLAMLDSPAVEPCKTCGGTGEVRFERDGDGDPYSVSCPNPDCTTAPKEKTNG